MRNTTSALSGVPEANFEGVLPQDTISCSSAARLPPPSMMQRNDVKR